MYKNILIPTDGSNLSRDAMLKGIDSRDRSTPASLFTASPVSRVHEFEPT